MKMKEVTVAESQQNQKEGNLLQIERNRNTKDNLFCITFGIFITRISCYEIESEQEKDQEKEVTH